MADSQPTDEHLRIAHSISEAIMMREFTKRQRKLLVCPNLQSPSSIVDSDPAQLLPLLLDQLVTLGDLARQISHALGGNGDRPEKVAELIKHYTGEEDGNLQSPRSAVSGDYFPPPYKKHLKERDYE